MLGSAEPGSEAYDRAGQAGERLARLGITVVSGCGSPATRHAAQRALDAGGLVGDDIMIGLVDERLRKPDADSRGYILDGFPRTVAQAEALDDITAQKPINVVIDLDVPREIVLERISSRRVCRDCGTNYTAQGDEPSPWICDVCGGDVQQRADDTPDAVNRRLDLYESQTTPLIEYYSSRGALAVVNGVGHPDHVFKRLTDVVETRR